MADAKEDARLAGVKPLAQRLAELDESAVKAALERDTTVPEGGRESMASFVKAFAAKLAAPGMRENLYVHGQGPAGSSAILDPETLHSLQDSAMWGDAFLTNTALLLRHLRKDDYTLLGTSLLFSAANAGNAWAIICIMGRVLEDKNLVPGVLELRQVARVRKRLENLAMQGTNYRATVLAGKLSYDEGDHEKAIAFWKQAIDGAIAASALQREGKVKWNEDTFNGVSMADLSAPWVELQTHYINHKDWASAKWAIAIGCQQDDPNSHFAASLFEKSSNAVQSGWFYHISKAATSGHVRAMHELGLWYAQDGWPYFEDEPPDELKPTPFDRFPPEDRRGSRAGSSPWRRLIISLGLSPPLEQTPIAHAFHSSAFPTTPKERFGMALEWLKVAMSFQYGPSFLAAAGLLLEKKLYSGAATPKEALELSDSRYIYASSKEYQLNNPINNPPREGGEEEEEEADGNPYYDPDEAKRLVREVFYADMALRLRRHDIQDRIKQGINQDANPYAGSIHAEDMADDLSVNFRKWFQWPEVRELFMDERTGRLTDRERNDIDLLEEARLLCEEQKWDIYGEDGSLIFRHGMRKESRKNVKPLRATRP